FARMGGSYSALAGRYTGPPRPVPLHLMPRGEISPSLNIPSPLDLARTRNSLKKRRTPHVALSSHDSESEISSRLKRSASGVRRVNEATILQSMPQNAGVALSDLVNRVALLVKRQPDDPALRGDVERLVYALQDCDQLRVEQP